MIDFRNEWNRFYAAFRGGILAFLILLLFTLSIFTCLGIRYTILDTRIAAQKSAYMVDRYAYNGLTAREQQLYDALYDAASAGKSRTRVVPFAFDNDTFFRVINCMASDYPELYLLNLDACELEIDYHRSRVKLSYIADSDAEARMEEVITEILPDDMDSISEEIELTIHDALVRRCRQSCETDVLASAYGALVYGKTDSRGYAAAFRLLCERAGISCFTLLGTVDDIMHAWNIVYINQHFYHVDVSMDDADFGDAPDMVFHGYFNLDGSVMMADHTALFVSLLPSAIDESGNYYCRQDLVAVDRDELERIFCRELQEAVEEQRDYIEVLPLFTDHLETEAIIEWIDEFNKSFEQALLLKAVRIYRASSSTNAVNIQLYYKAA